MKPLVCSKINEKYLLASRTEKIGLLLNENKYCELLKLAKLNTEIPHWIKALLTKLGIKDSNKINDLILFKPKTPNNYARVSYEITEQCNYKCRHCYLNDKKPNTLNRTDKENIIKTIYDSGCLWLQLTGGEPLLDKDFPHIYSIAHSLGFLIIVCTNGSLLTQKNITALFSKKPPYRLTISVYGAARDSYEKMTTKNGSFRLFLQGLDLVKSLGIRTRLNIIATEINQHELGDMIKLAKKYQFEHYIYRHMSPKLDGDLAPTEIQISENTESQKATDNNCEQFTTCGAGKTSFHVNCDGTASICKAVRLPTVNTLINPDSVFNRLELLSDLLFQQKFDCNSCDRRKICSTCPLLYNFYKKSGYLPRVVCGKI